MAITKPEVLPVWAESGDVVQPTNAEIQVGWPVGATPPSRQRFNWILNYGMNGVRYLTRRGIPDWDADDTYSAGDRVQGPDGLTYESRTTNTGATPASSPSDWRRWGLTPDEVSNLPVGAMLSFPGTTAPTGWAKMNGILVPRTGGWANLWAYAQASGNIVSDATWLAGRPGSFSTGDGSTTFRIPERRGLFDRGFHDGSGTYDSNTGTDLGQYRDSQNKAHTHTASSVYQNNPVNSIQSGGGTQYQIVTITTSSEGGVEAYPRHTSSLWCIKL